MNQTEFLGGVSECPESETAAFGEDIRFDLSTGSKEYRSNMMIPQIY